MLSRERAGPVLGAIAVLALFATSMFWTMTPKNTPVVQPEVQPVVPPPPPPPPAITTGSQKCFDDECVAEMVQQRRLCDDQCEKDLKTVNLLHKQWWRFEDAVTNPLYPGEPNSRTTTDILWRSFDPKQPFIRQDLITNDLNYVAPLSTSATIDRDYISKRPRIAIVTLVTSVWGHSYGVEEMGLQCYSATHGYDHHVDMIYLQPDRHFFSGRFRTALKYLPYYDYIVHTSLDIFPANRSRRIEDIPGFGADVLIPNRNFYAHWRCNGCEFPYKPWSHTEHPHTEFVVIKNSEIGKKFLQTLIGFAAPELSGANPDGICWDMSDIAASVIQLTHTPAQAEECNKWIREWRAVGAPSEYLQASGWKGTDTVWPYKEAHPMDFWMEFARRGPCGDVMKPGNHAVDPSFGSGIIRLAPSGEFMREYNDHGSKLRTGSEFLLHTKAVRTLIQKEDLYCIPVEGGSAAPKDRWTTSDKEIEEIVHREGLVNLPCEGCTGPRIYDATQSWQVKRDIGPPAMIPPHV